MNHPRTKTWTLSTLNPLSADSLAGARPRRTGAALTSGLSADRGDPSSQPTLELPS